VLLEKKRASQRGTEWALSAIGPSS